MSPIGSKIDLKGDPRFESAALFFVIILKFILTSIFEIKIPEKNSLTLKKFHFWRPIFNNHDIFINVIRKYNKSLKNQRGDILNSILV